MDRNYHRVSEFLEPTQRFLCRAGWIVAIVLVGFIPARAEPVSVGGLYNAGNAAARAGDVGAAVLHYERALVLEPRHADAAANLAFVRRQADLPAPPAARLLQWARNLPLRWWIAMGATGFWLIAGGLVLNAAGWLPRGPARGLAAAGAALIVAAAPALTGYHLDRDAVVILADDTPLQVAPAAAAERAAFARAGERATRLSTHADFTEIRLPDGRRGWSPTARVGSVYGLRE